MKKYLFLLLVFSFALAHSQNLESHIPSNTSFVGEINMANLKKAAPFSELQKTSMGQGMIDQLSGMLEREISSFDELGINTSASSYIFMNEDVDNLYLIFLFPLSDESVIASLMEKDNGTVEQGSGYKIYTSINEDTRMYWNSRMMSIVQVLERKGSENSSMTYLNATSSSISSNATYKKQKDDNAVLSFWMGDLAGSIERIAPFLGPMQEQMEMQSLSNLYKGYESISLQLSLDENESSLSTQMVFDDELSKTYKKISKQKFNSDIFNYVKLDDCMLYFSNNISVANALIEYPSILSEQVTALSTAEPFQDEAVLGITLLSTLLDEEAIGEIIRGDMLLVLSNLRDKIVEYTDYEYDSNFNQIPVTRERTEKVPEFMFLASTKEGDLSRKTFDYLLKKKYSEQEGSFYKVGEEAGLPFDLYFMIKNDILFVGTSLNDFRQISAGSFQSSVPSDMKNHIAKNQMAVYAGPKQAVSALSPSDFPSEETYDNISGILKESPDVRITSTKMKGNTISSSLTIETPKGHASVIMYILDIMERMK